MIYIYREISKLENYDTNNDNRNYYTNNDHTNNVNRNKQLKLINTTLHIIHNLENNFNSYKEDFNIEISIYDKEKITVNDQNFDFSIFEILLLKLPPYCLFAIILRLGYDEKNKDMYKKVEGSYIIQCKLLTNAIYVENKVYKPRIEQIYEYISGQDYDKIYKYFKKIWSSDETPKGEPIVLALLNLEPIHGFDYIKNIQLRF